MSASFIEFEEKEKKPTWKAYQEETDKGKKKEKEEKTTSISTITYNFYIYTTPQ
ncbi:hypothetical protein G9A89_013641 [Geosiphon pyriformis]|nr:hypothetical protein G9A89_013641 [Geosiphon pyriformis]